MSSLEWMHHVKLKDQKIEDDKIQFMVLKPNALPNTRTWTGPQSRHCHVMIARRANHIIVVADTGAQVIRSLYMEKWS